MGFAKAAELNHYPGPKHVLELAEPLHLTAQQRLQTVKIFQFMQQEAIRPGTLLVEEERRLDSRFATQTVTEAVLEKVTSAMARYQGQLRQVHLRTHVAQKFSTMMPYAGIRPGRCRSITVISFLRQCDASIELWGGITAEPSLSENLYNTTVSRLVLRKNRSLPGLEGAGGGG
jgi:hypothetical protein